MKTTQNKNLPFTINGIVYKGIKDLAPHTKLQNPWDDYRFEMYRDKFGAFVLLDTKLYPCFDSSDRMYENRYYRWYIISDSLESMYEKRRFLIEGDRFNPKYDDSFLAPLVYADDGKDEITIMILPPLAL